MDDHHFLVLMAILCSRVHKLVVHLDDPLANRQKQLLYHQEHSIYQVQ